MVAKLMVRSGQMQVVVWRKNLQDGLDVGDGGEERSDWVHGGTVY